MLTIDKIDLNIQNLVRENVKRIIYIYEPPIFYIGDACHHFQYLSLIKYIFINSKLDILCKVEANSIIKENPNIEFIFNKDWREISYENYELIIIHYKNEQEFLNFLGKLNNVKKLERIAIFSTLENPLQNRESPISFMQDVNLKEIKRMYDSSIFKNLFKEKDYLNLIKEEYEQVLTLISAHEIFISDSELINSKKWFDLYGVQSSDNIIILIDDATMREKLLNVIEYIKFINHISTFGKVKILVFDPTGKGKSEFYKYVLDENIIKKIVFAEQTSLRESICLMADKRVRMIFGPCTGLMHCASGVYSILHRENKIKKKDIPILITYTGMLDEDKVIAFNEYNWWYMTLVDCLKIVVNDKKEYEIKLLSENDKIFNDFIRNLTLCEKYTGQMLYNYILMNYHQKLIDFKLIDY